jgi:hypothetical protein
MCVPILLSWQGLVNAIVEVFVVGKDDMATNIIELKQSDTIRNIGQATYESFLCDICGCQTTRDIVVVNNHP